VVADWHELMITKRDLGRSGKGKEKEKRYVLSLSSPGLPLSTSIEFCHNTM